MEIIKNGNICTPAGFVSSATVADIKGNGKGKLDITLLFSDEPCNAAGVFTTNLVQAAPVTFCKELLAAGGQFAGVLVSSGNANACTGRQGIEACRNITAEFARALALPDDGMLLFASTGVIGNQLPQHKLINAVPFLCDNLDDDAGTEFAKAIMTTDTVHKELAVLVDTDEGCFVVAGAAKGAGMIDPAMATLLAFITTDAGADTDTLQAAIKKGCDASFNSLTVDGDMSTNDTLLILANGMSGVDVNKGKSRDKFNTAVEFVCRELAKMIAKDGEGATKFVTVKVNGAKNNNEAHMCAGKIARSPLVKTMFAGSDPNWGRLMSTAGSSGASFDPEAVSIWFNDLHYVKNGQIIDTALEKAAREIMLKDEYTITVDLSAGHGAAEYYTCDMTKEYIAINADYRS